MQIQNSRQFDQDLIAIVMTIQFVKLLQSVDIAHQHAGLRERMFLPFLELFDIPVAVAQPGQRVMIAHKPQLLHCLIFEQFTD